MKSSAPKLFVGIDALDDIVRTIESGLPEGLVVASSEADALATASRDLVRRLRGEKGQVEFYEPGGTDGLLKATNRLLEDIPIEQLSSTTLADGMRLLLVLNAEALGREEAAAIRRLATALRGSALRILLFARVGTVLEMHPTLGDFAHDGVCWLLDPRLARRVELAPEPPPSVPTPAPKPIETMVPAVAEGDKADDVDILLQLADERARARGLTSSRRAYSRLFWAMLALAVLVVAAGVGYILWRDSAERPTGPVIFDCSTHDDRELVRVLQKKLGTEVPTKLIEQGGTVRLVVGPLVSAADIERVRTKVWTIGACRIEPQPADAEALKK